MHAEVAKSEDLYTLNILWDMKKFFDSLDIFILIQEALFLEFPLLQLTLSLIIHHAPRRLKLGNAIGDVVFGFGRSILAGCKRSTDLARVYTIRMVKQLHRKYLKI